LQLEVAPWSASTPREEFPTQEQRTLACVYDLNVGIDWVEECLWYRRRGGVDELWAAGDLSNPWCAVRLASRGLMQRDACVRMFEALVRARWGYSGPAKLRQAGLIDARDLESLLARLAAERSSADLAAQAWASAPIVEAARSLGLSPRPSGGKPTSWQANCPGTNHWLMVHAGTGEWGCGWCKRKGGVDELQRFVEARRSLVQSRRRSRS
jgi:hypothetical protein